MKQVRWGIIGCGDVTELKSAPAFNKVPGFPLDMVMRRDAAKAEDSVAASWRFESGVTGSGFWNFGSHAASDDVVLHGEKGRIEFSVFGDVPLTLVTEAGKETPDVPHPLNIQHPHIENIRRHLAGEAPFPAPGREAVKVSAVMDRILGACYG